MNVGKLQCSRIHPLVNNLPGLRKASTTASRPQIGHGARVFDRTAKRLQRERAFQHPSFQLATYLRKETAKRIADGLYDVKKELPKILDIGGASDFYIARELENDKVQEIVCTDNSELRLKQSTSEFEEVQKYFEGRIKLSRHLCDLEPDELLSPPSITLSKSMIMPFGEHTFDAIVSNLELHWHNNLPLCLAQIHAMLKPDRPFIACMLGQDSLGELRTSLQLAESERLGGMAPHISPFAGPTDIVSLLGEADFKLVTVDFDDIVIRYPSMFELLDDLALMGENHCIEKRQNCISRDVLLAASAIYDSLYGGKNGEQGIPATFRVINMIGWKYGKDQPIPKERGSAKASLNKALNETEQ